MSVLLDSNYGQGMASVKQLLDPLRRLKIRSEHEELLRLHPRRRLRQVSSPGRCGNVFPSEAASAVASVR